MRHILTEQAVLFRKGRYSRREQKKTRMKEARIYFSKILQLTEAYLLAHEKKNLVYRY